MGAVRGALVGALSLIALEVLTRNADTASHLIGDVATGDSTHPGLVERIMSPDVPLISDHRKPAQPQSTLGKVESKIGGGLEWLNPVTAPLKLAKTLIQ